MEADWWKKGIGELIGAFTLVVGGAGSVLASNGNQLYAAFGHAFSIAVMGTALGAVSGGQISPAVTLGLVVTRHQKADIGAVIIVFQLIGSLLGGFLLRWLYPSQVTAGLRLATPAVSGITPEAGMLLELVMTFLVVFGVLATAIDPRGAAKTRGGSPTGLTGGTDWLCGGGCTGPA